MLAVLAVLAGGGLVWSVHAYKAHVTSVARRLVRELAAPSPTATAPVRCTAPEPSLRTPPGTARAVLQIPAISLTAPILAGTADATLDSGVGHLDASAWPDQGGVVVLAAHNVTFFTGLPHLRPGDAVTVTARCRSWTYRVSSHTVVDEGAPVANGPAPTLVMVTCWPTDALYFTHQRYVVTAALTSASDAGPTLPRVARSTPVHAALPTALTGLDLGPDSIGVPLGRLHVLGAGPHIDGAAGLQAANQAVRLLAAAQLAAADRRNDWWRVLAPAVPRSAAGVLAHPVWRSHLDVTVHLADGQAQQVTMTALVTTATGVRRMIATAAVRDATMRLTAVAPTR